MKSSSRRLGPAALVGVFLLLSGTSPASFARDVSDLAAPDARRDGGAAIEADAEPQPLTATVIVEAVVGRVLALAPIRFRISGGNKVFVSWVPTVSRIDRPIVGIIVDDGVPF